MGDSSGERSVELGCGLIGIGRKWGAVDSSVPEEEEAQAFLQYAFQRGIRFFDTAPSYGVSEERLGRFLSQLNDKERESVFVATKCGEHYNHLTQQPYTLHDANALRVSVERSFEHLDQIDLLQLHRPTPAVVRDERVIDFFREIKSSGIPSVGVSVSDVETATIAMKYRFFEYLQFPYNMGNQSLEQLFSLAREYHTQVIINRPFNSGKYLYEKNGCGERISSEHLYHAFSFILKQPFQGIVLTGTKNVRHLEDNIYAFQRASSFTAC